MDMTNAPPGHVIRSFQSKITRTSLSRSERNACGLPRRFYADLDFTLASIAHHLHVAWYFTLEGEIGQAEPRWPRRLSETVFGTNHPTRYTLRVVGIQDMYHFIPLFSSDRDQVYGTRTEIEEDPIKLAESDFPRWDLHLDSYPTKHVVKLDGSTTYHLDKVVVELIGRAAGDIITPPAVAPYRIGWDLSDFNQRAGIKRY